MLFVWMLSPIKQCRSVWIILVSFLFLPIQGRDDRSVTSTVVQQQHFNKFECISTTVDLVTAVDAVLWNRQRQDMITTNTTTTTGTTLISPQPTTTNHTTVLPVADAVQLLYGPISEWCLAPTIMNISHVFSVQRNPLVAQWIHDDDIAGWDVQHVQDFSYLFRGATLLNGKYFHKWNVQSATNFQGMFQDCCHNSPTQQWEGNLTNWNVSLVQSMEDMFAGAAAAIQHKCNISAWQVNSLQSAKGMFRDNISFQQNLCDWRMMLDGTVTVTNMFRGTACPVTADPTATSFCYLCRDAPIRIRNSIQLSVMSGADDRIERGRLARILLSSLIVVFASTSLLL